MENEIGKLLKAKIGFSAYDVFKESHERKGNGVYVADTVDSLQCFLIDEVRPVENYRFDIVRMQDVCMDLRNSDGEYWLESGAMGKFEKTVHSLGFQYKTERHIDESDGSPDVFQINVEGYHRTVKNGETVQGDFGDHPPPLPEKLDSQIVRLKNKIEQYNQSMKESVSAIFAKFEHAEGEYPREAVDLAIKIQNEITPYLIDVLKKVAANPIEYLKREKDLTDYFALLMLGCFKEPRAHEFILDIARLPDRIPQDLFGEIITDDLSVLLLRTCDGSAESIKSFIEDKEANSTVRGAAVEALAFSVLEGYIEREEALSFLDAIFTGDKKDVGSGFGDILAAHTERLCPVELKETIQMAYEERLISPGFISYDYFEETFRAGKEKIMGELADDLERRSMDDPHARLSALGFSDENRGKAAPSPKKSAKKMKSKRKKSLNKKKKKMKKASKKKNRR